jgi:predicted O-linked N-acetylglucosamine transferase (SPINDLY family)
LLNGQVIEAWAALCKQTPGSRILLAHDTYHGRMAERMAAWLAHFGATADGVTIECGSAATMYNRIDIALDTWPCSGDDAACDALWMGVPVVTRRGNVFAGRRTASVLSHAGLGEWISESAEGYMETARTLAMDLDALADHRRTLRDRFAASPVCDAGGYVEQLEGAYRHMWRRWCDRHR